MMKLENIVIMKCAQACAHSKVGERCIALHLHQRDKVGGLRLTQRCYLASKHRELTVIAPCCPAALRGGQELVVVMPLGVDGVEEVLAVELGDAQLAHALGERGGRR